MAYKYPPATVLAREQRTAEVGVSGQIPTYNSGVLNAAPVEIGDCDDVFFVIRCWAVDEPWRKAASFSIEESINGNEWAWIADMEIYPARVPNAPNMVQYHYAGKFLDRLRLRWQNGLSAVVEFDVRCAGK